MIVCILGMHRSGTSVAARVLNVLGVYLGPQDCLIAPRHDNPKGFWEHKRIVALNKELIGGPGGDIRISPDFQPKCMEARDLHKMRQQALSIIKSDFQGAEIWGWKDPRNCLTLPFWQSMLPQMHYVICVRHPVHSAQSLQKRDGTSLLEGIHSWLVHMTSGLEATSGQPRIIVAYEEMMQNPDVVLERLAAFIGHPERVGDNHAHRIMKEFIDPKVYHHRGDIAVTAENGLSREVLSEISNAYHMLQQQHDGDNVVGVLTDILAVVREQVRRKRGVEAESWREQHQALARDLDELLPKDITAVLVGRSVLRGNMIPERRVLPFLEHDGQYWGAPVDDVEAISELERMRAQGPRYLLFTWPTFWWLEYYSAFHDYLRSHYACVLNNERLVAFDLRGQYPQ